MLVAVLVPWYAYANAAEPAVAHAPVAATKASAVAKPTSKAAAANTSTSESAEPLIDIKKALREQMFGKKRLTLVISDKPEPASKANTHAAEIDKSASSKSASQGKSANPHEPAAHTATAAATAPANARAVAVAASARKPAHTTVVNPRASRDYIQAKAAALAGHGEPAVADTHKTSEQSGAHWSYVGATGPEAWGKLRPEFGVCASGKRQSPINIEESNTLQGPAETLLFNYTPSNGTVINNGHTVQVDVQGSNTLTVRGSNYALVQVHFHSPSEEQINFRNYAMVAHLVHKDAQGQLAVVAVLLEPGQANAFIDSVWTYMPLDVNDQVRMPGGLFDLKGLLPQDQRYYQFLGSLTTPPCTEGVLWMVLKAPVQISAAQLRLFQQLYPNNARPVQPINSRPVRSAQ